MRPHWAKGESHNLAMGTLLFADEQGRRMAENLRSGSMLTEDSATRNFELVSGLR